MLLKCIYLIKFVRFWSKFGVDSVGEDIYGAPPVSHYLADGMQIDKVMTKVID